MVLNYGYYFKADEIGFRSVIDMLLKEHMPDGGFNCRSNPSRAMYSSLQSTLSVFEGLTEYEKIGYRYRILEVKKAIESGVEFMPLHQLFISDRTGRVIHKDFLKFP